MTWKRAVADGIHKCGSCGKAIPAGELVASTRTGAERCEECGRKFEDPHDIVEQEDAAASSVPAGIRHQPSFGFERNPMASTGELARRHAANHFHRRTTR